MTVAVSEPMPEVRQVLLNRPDRRNAINLEMVSELARAIAGPGARMVILGSTSEEALSAGVDLDLPDEERAQVSRALYRLYESMRSSEAIVVTGVTGHAVGGGAQLVIASDVRVGNPSASIRFVGPGHGLAVGAWGLPGLIGRGRALDLTLGMRTVDAESALAIGLIDRIEDRPLDWALAFARHLTALPPGVAAAIKRIVAIPDPIQALRAERAHNDRWDGHMPPVDGQDGV